MHTPTESVSVDLREGGHYRYDMVHDDTGDRVETGGVYLEVVEPERLVFTWANPADPDDAAAVITVTMADAGDGRTTILLASNTDTEDASRTASHVRHGIA